MKKHKILIVDDEVHILELLAYHLEQSGYEVLQAETGEDALEILGHEEIDALVLDLMLPGIDGIEVLRNIRMSSRPQLPVLMLTAKNEEIDAVLGLEMGADDYIGKPFRTRELVSRVKSALRRSEGKQSNRENTSQCLVQGPIKIMKETHQVFFNEREVDLTLKEFELLEKLVRNPGRVFTRDELLEDIWGYDYMGETRTVDVHIRQLRKKIEVDDKNPELILTIRGMGYKFKAGNL